MTASKRLRFAVVGSGSLGRHHARNLGSLEHVELVAVCDPSEERGRAAAELGQTRWVAGLEELPRDLDAVSIAAPTPLHFDLARRFLEAGVHVLVEKPMTATLEQARALVAIAERSGRVCQVGHIERFNPALDLLPPLAGGIAGLSLITCERLTPHTGRSTDTSVVFDLMIHDIDLALACAGSPVERVEARSGVISGPLPDWAQCSIGFRNGVRAELVASRVAAGRSRKLRLYCSERVYEVDLDQKKVATTALAPGAALPAVTAAEAPAEEPLRRELADFVDCIRDGREPRVTARAGLAAIEVADRVAAAAHR